MKSSKTTTPARSVAAVNKALAEKFPGIFLAKNRGAASFHIYSDIPEIGKILASLPSTTICVAAVGHLTIEGWMTEIRELMSKHQEPIKYTSGPWASGITGSTMQEKYSQPYAIYQYGKENLIAGCFGDVRGGYKTAEANAKLIAVCPELLEHLKIVTDLCVSYANKLDISGEYIDQIIRARAVIKKATT